jgi:outer membrane murein-binding lipoprotein Lpp
MRETLVSVLLGAVLLACAPGAKEATEAAAKKEKDIGAQAADVASDTDALEAANEAAAPVVQAAGDCGLVREQAAEAERRLDEIAPSVRTAAGKVTFDAIRKRMRDIVQVCP